MEQRGDLLGRDAAARVAHREFDAIRPFAADLLRHDFDVALIRKLQRIRREIQEDSAQRHRVAHALVVRRREQADGEMLFFGDRPHDIAYRFEHRRHGECRRLLLHQLITALRELDDVARDRREPERGDVDQAELAPLHVVDGPALPALQRLGEDEDRRQRRAEIVGDVHEQRQPVAPRQLLGERLRPVRLNRDAHALHRDDQRQKLRVGHAEFAPALYHCAAQQLEQAAAQRGVDPRIDLLPDWNVGRRGEPRLVSGGRDQAEQLVHFILAGRARSLAPARQDGADRVLEDFAGNAARIRAKRMRWIGVQR